MSGGRLTVKLYAADELVPAFGVFDAVQQGAAEAYHSAAYYYGGKHPALNFYTSVPFGMYAPEHMAWWLYGEGEKLQDELYAPFGIKAIPAANTSAQAAGWFVREITGPDDLKGLEVPHRRAERRTLARSRLQCRAAAGPRDVSGLSERQ